MGDAMRKNRKKTVGHLWLIAAVLIIAFMLGRYVALPRIFPRAYASYVEEYAAKYGLEEALVYAVIFAESRADEQALSHKNAMGLMQITGPTGAGGAEILEMEGFTIEDLFEPETNIHIGCWYLRQLLNQFGNETTALAAYNAGSGNVAKWLSDPAYSSDGVSLKAIPFAQTEQYVKKVALYKRVYRFLYE